MANVRNTQLTNTVESDSPEEYYFPQQIIALCPRQPNANSCYFDLICKGKITLKKFLKSFFFHTQTLLTAIIYPILFTKVSLLEMT